MWGEALSLAAVLSVANGQGLRGVALRCSAEYEGKANVPVSMPGDFSVRCRCESGTLKDCRMTGRVCERALRGCHFVHTAANGPCREACKGCALNNNDTMSSGEIVRNRNQPCQVKQCFSGVVTTSTTVCPPTACSSPLPPRPGQCCPSCPRCRRAQLNFREGETRADPLDPCNDCTCIGGRLTCVRRVCPVLPCDKRLHVKEQGECCPTCARRSDIGEEHSRGRCLFSGQFIQPGAVFQPDACTNCTCSPEGATVTCGRRTCPPLSCPSAEQLPPSEGQCCPSCPPQQHLTSRPQASPRSLPALLPRNCADRFDGETWDDGCFRCSCRAGQTKCERRACPAPRPCAPGQRPEEGDGCCTSCRPKPTTDGVCTVFGDPHYRTFDGSIYNFQGSCKYLLASDRCAPGALYRHDNSSVSPLGARQGGGTFDIRITNDARNSIAFSWLRTVTLRIEHYKISLMQKDRRGQIRVHINGERKALPYLQMVHQPMFSIFKDGYMVFLRVTGAGKQAASLIGYTSFCGLYGRYFRARAGQPAEAKAASQRENEDVYTKGRGQLMSSAIPLSRCASSTTLASTSFTADGAIFSRGLLRPRVPRGPVRRRRRRNRRFSREMARHRSL